ncbi:MAG: 1-(5-phosphoribosyl)-5-[(5-phosphoribosylamino)methylideneamino]imidazole-4-carboxamide isomerase [Candidatus Altiarchaeota archaeon]
MEIIPAVDILHGKCAQLVGGRLGSEAYYGDPVEAALKWVQMGAETLHIIDLDATLETGRRNFETVKKIKEATGALVQFGGGIHSVEYAQEILDSGVDRIILGTLAFEQPDNLKALDPERTIVAIDSRKDEVVVRGWRKPTGLKPENLTRKFEDDVWGFLYTNVDVEGRQAGIEVKKIEKVTGSTEKPVIVSGGISSAEDVRKIEKTGAWGVVIGKALYAGKLNLKELLR